jgi:hypothetical protein
MLGLIRMPLERSLCEESAPVSLLLRQSVRDDVVSLFRPRADVPIRCNHKELLAIGTKLV